MPTEIQTLANLQQQFAVAGLRFSSTDEGLLIAHVDTPQCTGSIALQGAHVLGWQPAHAKQPVLWMSSQARFAPGKSIRGGIPVCWPWFGPHASGSAQPAHGYARTAAWKLENVSLNANGVMQMVLQLDNQPPEGLPFGAVALTLTVDWGAELSLRLSSSNHGASAVKLGEALHTYFAVSDIGNIAVAGLEGVRYWDTVGTVAAKEQAGNIAFTQETDRVYVNSPETCTIVDAAWNRQIVIEKHGSLSTVVWNPWTDKAQRMGDLGEPDGWRGFVCVETANAWDNCFDLAPGQSSEMTVRYSVEAHADA